MRTPSAEISPMRPAISESETPSRVIQSLSHMAVSPPPDGAAPGLRPLGEALAILMVDLVGVMPGLDRDAVLERLANRLDGHGRTPGGTNSAMLLGAVGRALIRLGA
ncbi:hypothetical protein GCM10008965_52310 [Methylorubrum aminovorans]|nr:hypothetical protein GCM10025880_08200 [Methylorubrum aminovorans]